MQMKSWFFCFQILRFHLLLNAKHTPSYWGKNAQHITLVLAMSFKPHDGNLNLSGKTNQPTNLNGPILPNCTSLGQKACCSKLKKKKFSQTGESAYVLLKFVCFFFFKYMTGGLGREVDLEIPIILSLCPGVFSRTKCSLLYLKAACQRRRGKRYTSNDASLQLCKHSTTSVGGFNFQL